MKSDSSKLREKSQTETRIIKQSHIYLTAFHVIRLLRVHLVSHDVKNKRLSTEAAVEHKNAESLCILLFSNVQPERTVRTRGFYDEYNTVASFLCNNILLNFIQR